jgi:hypothetical protein
VVEAMGPVFKGGRELDELPAAGSEAAAPGQLAHLSGKVAIVAAAGDTRRQPG